MNIKISTPQLRKDLVPRPQLIEKLNQALQRRLILVSAPAGFGKTTLIGSWLKENNLSAAWYSLEDSDNEPLRFLDYFVAALQNLDPNLGGQTQAQLRCSQPPQFDQLLTLLVNEILDYPDELIIVLDDYHHIHSSVIQDGLGFLLEHLPYNAHLIVVTRSDPALPIGRLRAQEQVLEFRTAQLRFSDGEAGDFFNRLMKLDLDPQQIDLLEQQTEGWVSGLQLAALSLQGRNTDDAAAFIKSFSGSHRYILDYLLEEVLFQQSPELQRFMFQTSILTRLNSSLCEAVTGQSNSQEMLEDLESRNLFVFPLDNERRWYRFHALFADLLQKHLLQSGMEPVQELHLRASQWHQEHGLINEAIDHTLLAGQPERAADLIELNTLNGFAQGAFYPFQYWLSKLPKALVNKRPLLCITSAWTEIWTSDHDVRRGDEWMQRAQTALSTIDPEMKPTWEDLRTGVQNPKMTIGEISGSYQSAYQAVTVGLRSAPDQSWVEKAKTALETIPDQLPVLRGIVFAQLGIAQITLGNLQAAMQAFDQAQRLGRKGGNSYGALLAAYIQADIACLSGDLGHAESLLRHAIKVQVSPEVPANRQPSIIGAIYAALGDILRERGQLMKARDFLERGLAVCKPAAMGNLGIGMSQTIEEEGYVSAVVALERLNLAIGNPVDFETLENLAARCSPGLERFVRLHQVRLWLSEPGLAAGGLQKAVRWAEGQPLHVAEPTWDWDHEIPSLLTFVRVKLAQARFGSLPASHPEWQEILRFMEDQEQVCFERGWIERVIEIQILKALAYQVADQIDFALDILGKALRQASGKGYQRLFLDEGRPMRILLYKALENDVAPDAARALLLTSSSVPQALTQKPATPSITTLPLSKREIEVLELMAEGLTNAEISQKLSIAMGTVKRHTANINLKLDTHNRTHAVARARALGVLAQD